MVGFHSGTVFHVYFFVHFIWLKIQIAHIKGVCLSYKAKPTFVQSAKYSLYHMSTYLSTTLESMYTCIYVYLYVSRYISIFFFWGSYVLAM